MPIVTKEHKERKRQQILKAAYRCFSNQGYHNTSMRNILAEAKLSAGAVYNYYSSKEEILQELVKLGQNSTRELLSEIFNDPAISNPLQQLLTYHFERIGKRDGLKGIRTDISVWAAGITDKKLMNLINQSFNETTQLFTNYISQAQTEGKLKKEMDPGGIAMMLISLIEGLTIQKSLNPNFDKSLYQKGFLSFLKSLGSDH